MILLASLVIGLFAKIAHASPPSAEAEESPATLFTRAEAAEESMQFAEAAQLYRRLLDETPSFYKAPRARARLTNLEAHAEGDYAPLTRLESVRRDPALAASPDAISALEKEAESFPDGPVRTEARLFAAGAWLSHLADPSRAIAPAEAVVRDTGADPLSRKLALRQLVEAHRLGEDLPSAVAAVDAFPELLPDLWDEVHREARRVWLRRGALGTMLALLLWGGFVSVRLLRNLGFSHTRALLLRPLPLICAAWIALAGAWLATSYDASDPSPFLFLGAQLVLIDIAARALSAGSKRVAPPIRAGLCLAAALAAAFLALDMSDPAYLDSFGL